MELICSNAVEHQHRVETRVSDVEGLTKPAWPDVLPREAVRTAIDAGEIEHTPIGEVGEGIVSATVRTPQHTVLG